MNLRLNAVMKFIVKLRYVSILLVLLLKLSYFFESQVNNLVIIMVLRIIFIFHTFSLLGILVNVEAQMCVVVLIFLY